MARKRKHEKPGGSQKKKELTNTQKELTGTQYKSVSLPADNHWSGNFARNPFFWIAVIAFLGASIYFQTYRFDFTQDDSAYSTENSATKRGLSGVPDVFTHGSLNYIAVQATNTSVYRPVTLLTFCIEHELFKGFNPAVGHIINIVLYFLVLLLVGLTLVRLFSLRKIPLLIPLLILLLYALHPIHTEVVASIKSRETLLCAFFVFGALYLWLITINRSSIVIKVLTGIIFLLGTMSKEEGITFVAVVFLISYVFHKMGISRSLKETLPFLLAAFAYLVMRSFVLDDASETYNALNKTYDSVLNNVIYPLQGQERLATNLYIYLHYIRLLIFPFPLSIDYSFSQITPKTFGNGWVLLSFFFFLFLIIGAFKNLSKRTVIGFGILYYLITFSIFSNFFESITIGATIGERFMFLPSLGFCIVLVYGLYLLAKRINSTRITPIVLAVLIPVSLVYSIKSFSRTKVWSDNIALYKSGLKTAPQSWRIHYNLAEVSLTQAQNLSADSSARKLKADSIKYWYQLAKKEYESAYKIIEGQTSIPFLLHLHYGDVLLPLEDTAGAKRAYQEAATSSPDLSSAWSNLGTVAYHQKDFVSAINYYRKALQAAAPDSFFLYASLGSSYMNLKDYPNAIQFFEKALQHGTDKRIATDLANLYATVGNQKKAESPGTTNTSVPDEQQYFRGLINAGMNAFNQADYRKAIKYFSQCEPFYYKNGGIAAFPDFLNVWAQSYLNVNDIGNAKATFSKVLREDPKNFIALHNLGFIAYQREKNYKQATEYLQRCLKANSPNYYSVYTGLGYLYSIQSMPDKAIESYESALKYGSSQDILNNLYQLWKSKGNQEKMDYYQALLTKK